MLPVNDLGYSSTHNPMIMDGEISSTVYTTMYFMNESNETGPQPPYWGTPETVFLSITLIAIMTVSLIGNALVIISVAYFKDMQRKTYVLIANLAIADFGVSLLCMPFSLVTVIAGDWIFPDIICAINGFLEALFLIASIHGLMHISIHKYFQLSKPLKRVVDKKWATVMITITWIVAFTVAMAPVVGLTENEYKPGTSQCGPKFPDSPTGLIHAAYAVLMGFIIPWTVLGFCYGFIFRNIKKHGNRMKRHSSMGQRRVFQQQKRITITLFIVFIVFFICWTPFIVFNIFGFTIGYDLVPIKLNAYCYWMGYLNSAINPVIYGWRNRSFKKAFREIRYCCNAPSTTYTEDGGVVPVTGRRSRMVGLTRSYISTTSSFRSSSVSMRHSFRADLNSSILVNSRRKRILNQPITPSSPENGQSGARRFKFQRQVSHISLPNDSSKRSGTVTFSDGTRSPLDNYTPPPSPLALQDPPSPRKGSPSHNDVPVEHTNPAFIADDDPPSSDPFDATSDENNKRETCDQSPPGDVVDAYCLCGEDTKVKADNTQITPTISESVTNDSNHLADIVDSSDEVAARQDEEKDSEVDHSSSNGQIQADPESHLQVADTGKRRKSSLSDILTIPSKIISTVIVPRDIDDEILLEGD